MKINPEFAQALQGGQGGQPAIDGDLRRLVARQAPLEDQQSLLAPRQVKRGEQCVDLAGVVEKERRLHFAGRRALPDDSLLRARTGQQTERAEQDALAGAGLARQRRKSRLKIQGDLLEQREIADAKRLEHGERRLTNGDDWGQTQDAPHGRPEGISTRAGL